MSDKTDDIQIPIGYILVTNGNPNEVGIPGTWVKIREIWQKEAEEGE